MYEENKGGRPVPERSIAKRDLDRQLYRETHVSKRAKRFITAGFGNQSTGKSGTK